MNVPAHVIRALLRVATAAHKVFVNSEGLVVPEEDYRALCVAVAGLDGAAPAVRGRYNLPAPVRADIALQPLLDLLQPASMRRQGIDPALAAPFGVSQVHPESALPSRVDFDTTAQQYGALAKGGSDGG